MCEVEFFGRCFKEGTSKIFYVDSEGPLLHCQIGYLEGYQFVKVLRNKQPMVSQSANTYPPASPRYHVQYQHNQVNADLSLRGPAFGRARLLFCLA